jgi:hypothetical protein
MKMDERRSRTSPKMTSSVGIDAFTLGLGILWFLVSVFGIALTLQKPMATWKLLLGGIVGTLFAGGGMFASLLSVRMKTADCRIGAELGVLVILACSAWFGPGIPPEAWTRQQARVVSPPLPMEELVRALAAYESDYGAFPRNLGNLLERDGFMESWKGPYLPPSTRTLGLTVKDEWGTPIAYNWNGGTYYSLRSAGPDRIFNTTDDLTRFEKVDPTHAW